VNDEIHAARQRLGIMLLADFTVTDKMPALQVYNNEKK